MKEFTQKQVSIKSMQNFLSEIKITIKNLLSRKGRSFLTILGIIIGVAGVIIIISLGAALNLLSLDKLLNWVLI
jgi:putative ABC transport system permease protein